MVYCQTLVKVVESGLMKVEMLFSLLLAARSNRHLNQVAVQVVDRVATKLATLLYASARASSTAYASTMSVAAGSANDSSPHTLSSSTANGLSEKGFTAQGFMTVDRVMSIVKTLRQKFVEWGSEKYLEELKVAFDNLA